MYCTGLHQTWAKKSIFTTAWSGEAGGSVEHQLTVIPRLGGARRPSLVDHAFPELHTKKVSRAGPTAVFIGWGVTMVCLFNVQKIIN